MLINVSPYLAELELLRIYIFRKIDNALPGTLDTKTGVFTPVDFDTYKSWFL